MSSVLKDKTIWLIAFNVFFVYAVYCGLTFFIPFLKNIYMLPVALVGAYGIINQYCLKMVGGPIGGLISDKILKSPSKYLCYTFMLSTVALLLLIVLPHESMPVYLGMVCTLGFGAIVFTQRAVFFAPIGEAKIAENQTGAAMALGSFIGYAPAMFCFSMYGYILDLNHWAHRLQNCVWYYGLLRFLWGDCIWFCWLSESVKERKCCKRNRRDARLRQVV